MRKKIFFTILLFSFLCLNFSYAEEEQKGIVVCSSATCSWEDLSKTVDNLMRTIVKFSFLIAFLMVTAGAFMLMFGGAKTELIKTAHNIIWTAIWAYVLILAAGIIFDIILDIFKPKLKQPVFFKEPIVLAAEELPQPLTATSFYEPLKTSLMSSLKCGENAEPLLGSQSLGRLFKCVFDAISLLTRVALILLAFAIISSAFYLITTPIFGFKQISRVYQILIWSIIGLIIILSAQLISDQIRKVLTVE